MGGRSFGAQTIVDGQITIAYGFDVVVLVFRVPAWSLEIAERLYEESTALTRANPRTIARMELDEPNPTVRKRLAELQAELDQQIPARNERRVAVITDSALTRGAVTALRWVTGDQIRGFASSDAYAAAGWVAHEDDDIPGIYSLYVECNHFTE